VKKLILVILLGALLTTTVFGEFFFSGGGRGVMNVFGMRFSDPAATTTGSETTWNTNGPEVVFKIGAVTDRGNMGMDLGISAASVSPDLLRPSNAKVWVKPFDWLKVTLGVFEEDELRYKIGTTGSGFGNYELYIRSSARDENTLFHRFKSGGFGTHIALTPIENLYIGAAFGSVTSNRSFAALSEGGAQNVFKNIQVGAGYKIPGVGYVRIQYVGELPFTNEAIRPNDNVPSLKNDAGGSYAFLSREAVLGNAAAVQAAFQLTLLEAVNIDIGASIPFILNWEQGDPMYGRIDPVMAIESQRPYIFGVGFDVNVLEPWRFYGRVDLETGGYKKSTAIDKTNYASLEDEGTNDEGTNVLASVFVSYNLGNNWILGVDINMDMRAGDTRNAIVDSAVKQTLGGDYDDSLTIERSDNIYNNYVDIGFGIWVRKNVAGGDIRAAATVKLPGLAGNAHKGAKPQLFFPVMFNYSF
jgi:hypothetical protein